MKSRNSVERYFNQKEFSILDIVLIIIAFVSLVIATFVQGGGPIGLPILMLSIIVICVYRSFKIKDTEIDQTLKRIIQDNKIECSENSIQCYELKGMLTKRRKDGKYISSNYYITNIIFSSEETLFHIYVIDLIKQSVETVSHSTKCTEKITLIEEKIKTNSGLAHVAHLEIDNAFVIPVTLNEYRTSQLVQKICEIHK